MQLRHAILLIVGTVGILFTAYTFQAYHLHTRSVEAYRMVNHTNEMLRTLQATKGAMHRYETYRLFAYKAGDSAYLDSMKNVAGRMDKYLYRLDSLTANHPTQQRQVHQIQAILEQKLQQYGHVDSTNLIGFSTGLENRISGLQDEERQLQKENMARFDRYVQSRFYFSLGAFVVMCLFWSITLYYINQNVRKRANAEAQAWKAETLYRQLLHESDLSMLTVDRDGIVQFISENPMMEQITGYKAEDIKGLQSNFPVRDGAGNLVEGSSKVGELKIRSKDGSDHWIGYRMTPVYHTDNTIKEYRIVAWDIDKEKRLALELHDLEAEQRNQQRVLQNIVDHLPVAVVVKDLDGTFVLANRDVYNSLSTLTGEIIGRKLQDFHPDPAVVKIVQEHEADVIREMRIISAEESYLRDGQLRHFYVIRFPIQNDEGQPKYIGAIYTDITERREREIALNSAKQESEEARTASENFLAAVSHEIRTPMSGVLGMTNLLATTHLNTEQQEYTDNILESARNLLTIINDLLDISKIKAGKFHFERAPFRLRHAVRKALYALQLRAEEQGLTLRINMGDSLPEVLIGDALRLQQIIINLVGNAVKFTRQGQIAVSIACIEQSAKNCLLEIQVQDTGIGIPEDKLDYIFEHFAQQPGEGNNRRNIGTGLGLAIVKQLVEFQNGSVEVKSEMGLGSTFRVVVPFEVGENIPATTSVNPIPSKEGRLLQGYTVLIAEDNVINQKVLRSTLLKQGADVQVTQNGKQAVDALRREHYDVVLMDLQMPEMDGLEATNVIRQEISRDVPIIAMTADALKGERERCLQAGMNGFISKPFDPADLFRQIVSVVMARPQDPPPATEAKPIVSQPESVRSMVDLSFVTELSGDDPAYVRQVINIFLDTVYQTFNALETLVDAGTDFDTIRRQAHQLKSSFGVVRIQGAMPELEKLEKLAKNTQDIDSIRTTFKTLRDIFSQAEPELLALQNA